DGMPGMPRKQGLAYWLSRKGYWVFYPRFRGCWESGGRFLRKSPEEDLKDVLDGLFKPFKENTFGKKFRFNPKSIFVVGGSFGGAAAVLSTLDPRVTAAVANCPVVDWAILREEERKETSNPSYTAYLKEAFGEAYRLSPRDWAKLYGGRFYNPAFRAAEIDPAKVLMFHAQDDPYVPWRSVAAFAEKTGARLVLLKKGGHLSTNKTLPAHWRAIAAFFRKAEGHPGMNFSQTSRSRGPSNSKK
ncbi:MAG TPA: alpha/beta fold hydrolase, partial [bacterium]|nr:alpha/beta fold hydrolase [bacterium]